MSLLTEIMDSTITVYPKAGFGAHGPVYSTPYEAACYIEQGFKRVTDQNGEDVVSSMLGVFAEDCEIEVGDKALYGSRYYRAISVQKHTCPGEEGHVEVRFGSVAS